MPPAEMKKAGHLCGAGPEANRPWDAVALAVALLADFTLLGCFDAARMGAFFARLCAFIAAGAFFVFGLVSGEGDGGNGESEDGECFVHKDVRFSV